MFKNYFYEIDGLRFYAFLLILINHSGLWKAVEGHTFFFTLSGFLIGYTTVYGIKKEGTFLFKTYMVKRVLRTFPLYFLIVLGCGVLYVLLTAAGTTISFANYWSFFLFLQNYFGYGTIFILTNLWAMAVTEQLYFGWGLFAQWQQQKVIKLLLPLCILVIIISFILQPFIPFVYTSTLNYVGVYLLGAYCSSLYLQTGNKLHLFLKKLGPVMSMLVFGMGIMLILYGFTFSMDGLVYLQRVHLLASGFCLVVLSLCFANLPFKIFFNHPWVRYLGKVSYGLYCYHAIALLAVTQVLAYLNFTVHAFVVFILTLVLTIIAATISYEHFEKRFMAKKIHLHKLEENGKNKYQS